MSHVKLVGVEPMSNKHREYMVKLNVLIFHNVINSEAGIFISLFLIFDDFEPRCSHKFTLIKKSPSWRGVVDVCRSKEKCKQTYVVCVNKVARYIYKNLNDIFMRMHEIFISTINIFYR